MRSITSAGAATHQASASSTPGTMKMMNPRAQQTPEMIPIATSGRKKRKPVPRHSPKVGRRPDRSLTVAWITAPCSTALPMMLASQAAMPSTMRSGENRLLIIAEGSAGGAAGFISGVIALSWM